MVFIFSWNLIEMLFGILVECFIWEVGKLICPVREKRMGLGFSMFLVNMYIWESLKQESDMGMELFKYSVLMGSRVINLWAMMVNGPMDDLMAKVSK